MRKRPRRKQSQQQQQPLSIVTNKAVCDSSSALLPSYVVPLCCYLLLFTSIVLFTLNPVLPRYAGSYPWSFAWLSGVHADINNGEHQVQHNASALDTQGVVLSINKSFTSNLWKHSLTYGSPISGQDLKCRPLLFRELLSSTSFPACSRSHRPSDGKKKSMDFRGSCEGLRSTSDFVCKHKGQVSSLLSFVNDTGYDEADRSFESPQPQGGGEEQGPSDDSGQLHVDVDEEHLTRDCPDGYSTHVGIGDHMQTDTHNDTQKQADYDMHDHAKKNEELQSTPSVDNQTNTSSSPNDASVNGGVPALVTPDVLNKTHSPLTNLSRIHLRQEPGDGPYNYASDSKGAKILASNKEAKGASNILNKDKDKYFRTPCNVETKFVDIELSEEMLVVEIVIANHEFYSSNVREFAVWGTLTYPTGEWVLLAKLEAENSRVSQTFRLKEPQWVRYLKLQMLSHYGTDFYCTLSLVEVHGVDAIEWLLEDWIAEELGASSSQAPSLKDENSSLAEKSALPSIVQGQLLEKETTAEEDIDSLLIGSLESTATEKPEDVPEVKVKNSEKSQPVYHQTGRPGLDAVMKLLMQKVRILEHKQPLLSRSLEEMEARYRDAVGAHTNEITAMMGKMESLGMELASLNTLLKFMEGEWKRERVSLEREILDQVNARNADFEFLRDELKRKGDEELVALTVSLFSVIVIVGIQMLMLCWSVFKPTNKQKGTLLLPSCRTLCVIPFLSCILVMFVFSV